LGATSSPSAIGYVSVCDDDLTSLICHWPTISMSH
jgi:hypothetical protein